MILLGVAPVVAAAFTICLCVAPITLHLPPKLTSYQLFSVSITLSFSDLMAPVGIVSAHCPQNGAGMATYAPAGDILCLSLAALFISRLRSRFCSRHFRFRSAAASVGHFTFLSATFAASQIFKHRFPRHSSALSRSPAMGRAPILR